MAAHTVIGGGDVRLYVEETGNPKGRPILFIHGFSQNQLTWRKQLGSDLADDFRLVALDLRGHGLSEKPQDAYGDSQGLLSRSLTNDDLLPSFKAPVLITHGDRDDIVLPEAAKQHAESIERAQLSIYSNIGHAPFWEDSDRFNRELREFILERSR